MEPRPAQPPSALTGELVSLIQDLKQGLVFQKSLGVTHADPGPEALARMAGWGSGASRSTRFCEQGPGTAPLMIIDSQGGFYQGKAGELLVKILHAMGLTPDQVHICNTADLSRIRARINAACPRIIITLGPEAASLLCQGPVTMDEIQGRVFEFCGVPVMPTRHPEALLSDPSLKRGVWENMQKVMATHARG